MEVGGLTTRSEGSRTIRRMHERTEHRTPDEIDGDLAELLAPLHAAALRLAQGGAPPAAIAAQLGIPEESVPGILEVAAAKLDRLQREGSSR